MITIDFARSLYAQHADADSAHDFDHVLRVVQMAEKIALVEGANLEIVRTAAWLHDIGLDDGRAGHETLAANRAREILKNLAKGSDQASDSERTPSPGYSDEFIEAVAHAIEAHRFRSGPAPQTLEAKVLFDADKLDAIGAIGVARAFAFGGHRGQKLWAAVPFDFADTDSPEHTPVHEYIVKLRKIKDRMQTATGRSIAEERHAFMVKFFERLDQEVKSEM